MNFACIIPTYKEKTKIENLLESFDSVSYEHLYILIVNANYFDETSILIKEKNDPRVIEIQATATDFWSATINKGLDYILDSKFNGSFEYIIIMNSDITFNHDIFSKTASIIEGTKRKIVGAFTESEGKILSSGVMVMSWLFAINKHPYAGLELSLLPPNISIAVDYLPTRFIAIPKEVFDCNLRANAKKLPHYCADYEFTHRLKKMNYELTIFSNLVVHLDKNNTGLDPFLNRIPFQMKISMFTSVKSHTNLLYRTRFVLLTHPKYSIPTAVLVYAIKAIIEIMFGYSISKKLSSLKNFGFSGSK